MEIVLRERRKPAQRKKVSVYIDEVCLELYNTGRDNGWDTADLVRQAIEIEILKRAKDLKTQKPKAS